MKDAGDQMKEVLLQMNTTGLVPLTLYYNIAIKAWIKSQWGCQSAKHANRFCVRCSPLQMLSCTVQ